MSTKQKSYLFCWSHHERGYLLLWTGQWMGDPEPLWPLLPPWQVLTWVLGQHTERSTEEQATLKELQEEKGRERERAEAAMKSGTHRIGHVWSQPDLFWGFSLASANNSVFCLSNSTWCWISVYLPLKDSQRTQFQNKVWKRPSLILIPLFWNQLPPTTTVFWPQAFRALPLSQGLHSDTPPRPALTPKALQLQRHFSLSSYFFNTMVPSANL